MDIKASQPPHSFEAESAVIGGLIFNPSLSLPGVIASGLEPDEFWNAKFRESYKAILDMADSGAEIDLITVKHELDKRHVFDGQWTVEALAATVETVPVAANAGAYAKIVKSHAIKRRMLRLSGEINDKAAKGIELNGELDELARLGKLLDGGEAKRDWKKHAKVSGRRGDELIDLVDKPIPFVVHPILASGFLTQIQGSPKGGKSSFSLYLSLCAAYNIWPSPDLLSADRPLTVLYLAWEDPDIMMAKRLSLYTAGLGLDRKALPHNVVFLFAPSILVDEDGGAQALTDAIKEYRADILVIDTLSHIHSAESENDSVDMGIAMFELTRIAQETQVAVLYVHHTAKGSKDKDTHEKSRGSMAIIAAWHIMVDWGRREEGSNVNPIEIQSKLAHEWMKWQIAYIPEKDESGREVVAVKWDIQAEDKRDPGVKETSREIIERKIIESVSRLCITKDWASALDVANDCNLGLSQKQILRILQRAGRDGKALSKDGPRGIALFKPIPSSLPSSP